MQRYTLDKVSDDANLFRCFDQIVHFDNVRMINFLQSHYFTLDRLTLHGVVEFCFLVNFNGKLPHVDFVVADIDDSVSSLTDRLADLIVLKDSSLNCLAL